MMHTVSTGETVLFDDIQITSDLIFTGLISPSTDGLIRADTELDALTKQVLDLLHCYSLIVTQRQLTDFLVGGCLSAPTLYVIAETESIPKTNVGSEQIFSSLDHLVKVMPSATITVCLLSFY